jgi:hypothetical protein
MYCASFLFLYYYNKQRTINIIAVYITTVCLCKLHCYMFRHFHVIIMVFKNALLSYIRF